MTAEREALERLERQLSTCRDSYEAPSGKIMFRVWGNDLGAILKLACQALANPATIRDTDEDAEWLRSYAKYLTWLLTKEMPKPLFFQSDVEKLERIAARLASSPAEPREASGYCPYCMTADPVAPAEGDAKRGEA